MVVQDIMVSDLVTIDPSASIAGAAAVMRQKGTTSLFVTHAEKLLGIITDSDILYNVVAQGYAPAAHQIWEFMDFNPPVANPGMDILALISLMDKYRLTKLPVIEVGKLIGTVTLADIASKLDLM